jgi:HK97 family phage major capsid protein
MSLTTSGGQAILSPEQVGELVIRPLAQESVALGVSTVHPIVGPSLRVPAVTGDPTAAWVAEGAEIPVSEPTLTEVNITPSKLAGLVVVSNELAADSSPAALQVVGQRLVRDLSRKIDAAYFGNATVNGPSGLLFIAATAVDAGDAWANFDFVETAKSNAEQHNTAWSTRLCATRPRRSSSPRLRSTAPPDRTRR